MRKKTLNTASCQTVENTTSLPSWLPPDLTAAFIPVRKLDLVAGKIRVFPSSWKQPRYPSIVMGVNGAGVVPGARVVDVAAAGDGTSNHARNGKARRTACCVHQFGACLLKRHHFSLVHTPQQPAENYGGASPRRPFGG